MQRIDKLVLISKAPWYKEASGVLAVASWLALLGVWTWAMVTGTMIDWWYLVVVTVIAVISSMLRGTSANTSVEKFDL